MTISLYLASGIIVKTFQDSPVRSLNHYGYVLDQNRLQEIKWMPYTEEVTVSFPKITWWVLAENIEL
ncbi:hypothetical protein L6164_023793 [Bauhinia variegata]|uniref:Uncharacterized protein n=1 Tax=Bauhinia variegata TaxID=167791 RepID=A0ACB9MJW1_BAUVA|nr:hypothetical protein L6164_023793 [Bauhinia variegata]